MGHLNDRARTILVLALLGLVTLGAYWPTFHNGFVRWDDTQYITLNPQVRGGLTWENIRWAFQTGYASNWHPLTWISHMLDVEVFGLRPAWHHAMGLLFHIANTLLLFALVRRLTGATWRSAAVAALFALHPLHVESVAWASERKDVLSTFWFLLAIRAYVAWAEGNDGQRLPTEAGAPAKSSLGNPPWHWYGSALLCFVLALMSKQMVVTLPFVLLLLDFWPLRRSGPGAGFAGKLGRLLVEKAPFLVLAAAASLITVRVQGSYNAISVNLPIADRLANAVVSYLKYVAKTIWPVHLSPFYPHPVICFPVPRQWPAWQIGLATLLLLLISLLVCAAWRRRPWLAVGWLWFVGTMVPVIGLVQVGSQAMADRYTYLPHIGLFIALVWTAAEAARSVTAQRLLAGAAAAILLICGALTFLQVQYWRNTLTLFQHAVALDPQNARAEVQVAYGLLESYQYEAALRHCQAALKIDPNSFEAYYAAGRIRAAQGRREEAIEQFRAALRLRPWLTEARVSLGIVLWELGRHQEAKAEYQEALHYDPNSLEARYRLGIVLAEENQLADAAAQFEAVVQQDPGYADVLSRLAETWFKLGDSGKAELTYRRLVQRRPRDAEARVNHAGVFWKLGKGEAALAEYSEAVRLAPLDPVAHYNKGYALARLGRPIEAEPQLKEAVRLKPDYTAARTELGRLLVASNRLPEGLAQFEAASRLAPTNALAQVDLATTLQMVGRTNEAAAAFALANKLAPDLATNAALAGMRFLAQKEFTIAMAQFSTALQLQPEYADAMAGLAWILATHPEPERRDGPRAVALAQRACELNPKHIRYWTALDAAYAQVGRFTDAIAAAKKVRELALAAGDQHSVEAADNRLALYNKQQPFHY